MIKEEVLIDFINVSNTIAIYNELAERDVINDWYELYEIDEWEKTLENYCKKYSIDIPEIIEDSNHEKIYTLEDVVMNTLYKMIKGDNMKEKFECPIADTDTQPYTTEECGVCHCFWDCETGLKKCLNDNDYSNHHEDIKKALNNMEK